MKQFFILLFVMIATVSEVAYADKGFKIPPAEFETLAKKYEYSDFPKAIDIISIMRVESGFDPHAFNPEISKINPNRKVPPSNGLMQVQDGSFEPEENIRQGAERLHEYYTKFNRSVIAAVKSYNIGPGNYKRKRLKVSGKEYWDKYKYHRKQYVKYYSKVNKVYLK